MPLRPVYVRCGQCNGTGRVLHNRLTEVVGLLYSAAASGVWMSTAAVSAHVGIGETNAANLLRRLHGLGIVDRRGAGANRSPYEWHLTPPMLDDDAIGVEQP